MCKRYCSSLLTIASLAAFSIGCKEEPLQSLYTEKPSAAPAVTSVTPRDSALAGVSLVTITGTGFSPAVSENIVYFNAIVAEIQQASATQLIVKSPILISDTISIRVAVQGKDQFSNAISYKLKAAVSAFGGSSVVEEPNGVTCDSAGNVYVSLLSAGGSGLGVKKITPTGVRTDYSPAFSTSVNKWTGMKVGPGGFIYTTSNRNAVFRIPANGGNSVPWASTGGVGVSIVTDIDFDNLGNIWGGGDNQSIVRITPGAPGSPPLSSRAFPFVGDVRSVRFYQNYLYLAAKTDTIWNIYRTRIVSADSIGPREVYFNFTAKFGSAAIPYAITFANDGDLFVGTDSLAGSIVVIHPDRTAEKFYSGLFAGRVQGLAYGRGTEMYASQTGIDANKKLLRINTQKQGAPYYGRQ